jgi:hypothetical protein
LDYTYGLHKEATGEALTPQTKETSSTAEQEISFFVGYFCPPGSGFGSAFSIRIRIQSTKMNADPDPKHWVRPSPVFMKFLRENAET